MNKITRKFFAILLSCMLVVAGVATPAKTTDNAVIAAENVAKKGTVTMTVERITIGQGYLVSPVQVEIQNGDTVDTVFKRVMDAKGFKYDDNGYLASIENADTGKINIPAEISAMPDTTVWGNPNPVKAPTNTANDGNSYANKGLGSSSYHTMAGWMFTINNVFSNEGAASTPVKDGDVIRWQFSVYGYGADIGSDTESYTGIKKVTFANKDELIKEAATLVNNKTMMKDADVKVEYNNAIKVLEKYNPSETEVKNELTKLKNVQKDFVKKTTVTKASVKGIKNVKGLKAKVAVKKIKGVTGYQYKYSNNKKFKKAVVKSTKKNTLTTKKFKKNQKCYVTVRAYKKVNGIKYYGRWSKVKAVKIKK